MKTPDSTFSLQRLKTLTRSRWKTIAVIGLAVTLGNTFQALTEVPLYVSTSKLQVQAFEASRTIDDKAAAASEMFSDSLRLNSAVLVFQSKIFLNELARELQSSPDRKRLVLSWGIGRKLKFSYALYRLGLAKIQYQKLDPSSLSSEELGLLLSTMIKISPLPAEQTIEIRASALEEWTAFAINKAVMDAFVKANLMLDQDEFERSIAFLTSQVDSSKSKLDASEEKLAAYLKEHLNVSSESTSSTYLSEYLTLRSKRKEIETGISADRKLIDRLQAKLKNNQGGRESMGEVLEALKEEQLRLKYQHAKLLEQGYGTDHPGVVAMSRKIATQQEFIERSEKLSHVDERDILGAGQFRRTLATKILQIQDGLIKQDTEVKAIDDHLLSMQTDVKNLPESGMIANALKREVLRAADLHGELKKRLEFMRVRSQAAKNTLRVVTAPNEINAPNEIPFLPRFLFSLLAGILLGLSAVLLLDMLNPRIVTRADVEASGFRYAGKFFGTSDSCTEVLAAMECIFSQRKDEDIVPTVLCSSAERGHTLKTFLPLIDFMASRNEKVLVIAEDPSLIPDEYQSYRMLEGVKTYSYPNGMKNLIQIDGAQSFGVIRLLLDEYANHYSAIFLFVAKGSESSAYSLCRNMANRILIFGVEGSRSVEEYRKLVAGFKHQEQTYMAILPADGIKPDLLRWKRMFAAVTSARTS